MNVKKTKVMVFNYVDPCQEFVFEGDVIKRVQTFKYLGILLKTTSNLDSAVERLVVKNRRSLSTLNRRYVELYIMDGKLPCDLFNTLVHFIVSYDSEVWVDSKKIEAIEIMYRGFLKSLPRVKKISTSIVFIEFGKVPFEHFAWGKALLYYNSVSMIIKDHILRKVCGSLARYAYYGKELLGWICERMATQDLAPRGGKFLAFGLAIAGNNILACSGPCVAGEDC